MLSITNEAGQWKWSTVDSVWFKCANLGFMNRPKVQPTDSYLTKIVKYIPTEIIAGYVTLSGFILGMGDQQQFIYFWLVFIVLLILTPLYLHVATSESGKKSSLHHPVAGALAFAAWAFATGGPFVQFQVKEDGSGWYTRTMGSIVLVLVCLCLPLIERALPSKSENAYPIQETE
jgi:hypothetical protein